MDRLKRKTYKPLLEQRVAAVSRLALYNGESCSILMDTLVFTLEDNNKFELLISQADVAFERIEGDAFFTDFQLEDKELLILSEGEQRIQTPFKIQSITEYFAGAEETAFLVAVVFWDDARKPALCICTETDEIEIIEIDDLRVRVDRFAFEYKCVHQYWYSS